MNTEIRTEKERNTAFIEYNMSKKILVNCVILFLMLLKISYTFNTLFIFIVQFYTFSV